ncbi:DUF1178 family protein [Oceanibium sediminis]|uniref:DUF1178 family protein n=1 Tax=Oceanibium sediminis TaxID=2026339 RepID=UPI000DD3620D|nr:DUF1178 family protein [Oceanibium sediminis]
MIRYRLTCAQGHDFESWFSSGKDYDRLEASGHLACAVCGGGGVKKALMAPKVVTQDEAARPLSQPASAAEQALKTLRNKIESEATDVGRNFATEARAQHEGTRPQRPIYGEAKLEDARALIEEGIPVAPLPWSRKATN